MFKINVEHKMIKKIILLVLVCFTATGAYGQSEVFFIGHQFGVGARAMSMGGAFSAVADDYTATYWNPAGLSQIRRMEFLGSMSNLNLENESSANDKIFVDETNATKINSLGFVFPIPTYRGSLVFAVGYNRVRAFDNGFLYEDLFDAGTDSAYDRTFTEIENGGLTNWVFSGAMEVSPNLSLGASFNLWRGNDDYQWIDEYNSVQNIYYFDTTTEYNISTKYSAANFKLGAFYQLGLLGNLAATISTPVKLNSKEDWSVSYNDFDDSGDPEYADYNEFYEESGAWDYEIEAPFTFSAGAAFTLFPNLIVSGDVEYTDWSQLKYKSEPPVGELGESNRYFKRNYRATTQFRVGAEFTVPLLNMQLRAGAFNKPTPLEESNITTDRRYLTAGVGVLLDKQVKLDVAYLRGWWTDESYLSEEVPSVEEDISINKILATIAFRF